VRWRRRSIFEQKTHNRWSRYTTPTPKTKSAREGFIGAYHVQHMQCRMLAPPGHGPPPTNSCTYAVGPQFLHVIFCLENYCICKPDSLMEAGEPRLDFQKGVVITPRIGVDDKAITGLPWFTLVYRGRFMVRRFVKSRIRVSAWEK
jgi:hypothetical protein